MLAVSTAIPDRSLRPLIRRYVQREADMKGAALIEPVVARLGAMLEFHFADPYEVPTYGSDKLNPVEPVTVIGPITYRRVRLRIRGHLSALSVLFHPFGLRALFGVPMAPLADRGTEGHSVLSTGLSALNEQLGNASSFDARVGLLDRYFVAQMGRVRPQPSIEALRLLIQPSHSTTVESVARSAGISIRQLERISLDYAGVPPRMLTRIARFECALHLKTSRSSWTDVAHAAAYHDQMHMIRDFRQFAGESPGRAVKQIFPEHLISLAR